MYIFEYEDLVVRSNDILELDDIVVQWVKDNWQEFNDWVSNQGSTLIKDNYDDYYERFFDTFVRREE